MTACGDCGARRGGPLCAACSRTAAALGFTAVERLRMLDEHTAASSGSETGADQ